MRYAFPAVVLLPLVALACSAEGASSSVDGLGSPGVTDAADKSCNVILRDIHTNENRGSVEENCVGSGQLTCWVVFSGDIDVSAVAVNEGDVPWIYWQSGSDPNWYSAPTTMTTGRGVGMERFHFDLTNHTALGGQAYPTIQVIPYLQTVVGTRLFDHNNTINNYVLDQNDGWNYGDPGDACYDPPPIATGTISFGQNWTVAQGGELVAGGKLVVDYDITRMPQCIGLTTDGVPAWDTIAYAKFSPSGQIASRSVRGVYDTNANAWSGQPFELDIPAGADSVALWFHTSGDGCQEGWDSDYGQNFVYAISQSP